jgi:3-oxoacyl-[acyl-carrier protein] reductase
VTTAQAIHQGASGAVDVLAIRCDVAAPDEVARFGEQVRARLGHPRLLVNNAGVVARGRLDEQEPAEWRRVLDVNLVGAYAMTREFLPAMRAARAGRMVNVSSISGRQGTAQLTAYCASKHALVGLTRALAEEVRQDGVQVNAVCPGSVDTAMLVGSGFAPAMSATDVANVIVYLAIYAPDAMTGACLDVFG